MEPEKQRTHFAIGALIAGKYEITRRIGAGGMGEVFEARHVRMNKRVAIKVLSGLLAQKPEYVGRFLREAEAAARIRHPNVIEVFDVEDQCDPPFMVMEYLDGCSMQRLIERTGGLSVRCCATLLLPALRAVHAAHERKIIHRDLKPDNIYLAICGDFSLRPVVLDFGIAKVSDSVVESLSSTRAIMGTIMYMSPEQIANTSTVTAATDQYALGAIAYECVAGRLAFGGDSIAETFDSIRNGSYPSLSELKPSVDRQFEMVIRRAMALKPADRYESVAAFADAVAPFATDRYDEIAEEIDYVWSSSGALVRQPSAESGITERRLTPVQSSSEPRWVDQSGAQPSRTALRTLEAPHASPDASASIRPAATPSKPADEPAERSAARPSIAARLVPIAAVATVLAAIVGPWDTASSRGASQPRASSAVSDPSEHRTIADTPDARAPEIAETRASSSASDATRVAASDATRPANTGAGSPSSARSADDSTDEPPAQRTTERGADGGRRRGRRATPPAPRHVGGGFVL